MKRLLLLLIFPVIGFSQHTSIPVLTIIILDS